MQFFGGYEQFAVLVVCLTCAAMVLVRSLRKVSR